MLQLDDVAARHGAVRSLVFAWRRQARDGLLTADVPGEAISPFVPVRLRDGPGQPLDRPISARSPSSPAPSRTVGVWLAAATIDMRRDFDGLARQVQQALGTARSASSCSCSAASGAI